MTWMLRSPVRTYLMWMALRFGYIYIYIYILFSFLKFVFRNKASFYDEQLLAPRTTPKMDDHPLSVVCDCLFNTFAAMLHSRGRSSIRNLRTRHALVSPSSVRLIKSRIMGWVGHVAPTGRREAYTGFWRGNLRERDHLGDPGVDGSIILRWIFKKWNVGVWIELDRAGSG